MTYEETFAVASDKEIEQLLERRLEDDKEWITGEGSKPRIGWDIPSAQVLIGGVRAGLMQGQGLEDAVHDSMEHGLFSCGCGHERD